MPKYLVRASYSREGLQGLLKEGGSNRRQVVAEMLKGMGVTLETFYFAFGDEDVFVTVDAPDNVTVAAVALAINASGAVSAKTTVLMTPEEVDAAIRKTVNYRPPGK
jgi:uncharacterized protein with GYD domain